MKKTLLSAVVIAGFVFYSLGQRGQNDPPTSITQTSQDGSNSFGPPNTLNAPQSSNSSSNIALKDGSYTGSLSNAFYGYVQVSATVTNGKLVDVQFLRYPNDRRQSMMISHYAMPRLQQEAIKVQSGNVNIVSGATDTSLAFRQSLSAALSQAR